MAYLRKKRRHPAIMESSLLFSKAINEGNYKKAAIIVFLTALQVGGTEGIMDALDNANSFYLRKDKRRGL